MSDEDRQLYWQRLREAGRQIPPDVLRDLRRVHDEQTWECAAHSEGQMCCLDLLTE